MTVQFIFNHTLLSYVWKGELRNFTVYLQRTDLVKTQAVIEQVVEICNIHVCDKTRLILTQPHDKPLQVSLDHTWDI